MESPRKIAQGTPNAKTPWLTKDQVALFEQYATHSGPSVDLSGRLPQLPKLPSAAPMRNTRLKARQSPAVAEHIPCPRTPYTPKGTPRPASGPPIPHRNTARARMRPTSSPAAQTRRCENLQRADRRSSQGAPTAASPLQPPVEAKDPPENIQVAQFEEPGTSAFAKAVAPACLEQEVLKLVDAMFRKPGGQKDPAPSGPAQAQAGHVCLSDLAPSGGEVPAPSMAAATTFKEDEAASPLSTGDDEVEGQNNITLQKHEELLYTRVHKLTKVFQSKLRQQYDYFMHRIGELMREKEVLTQALKAQQPRGPASPPKPAPPTGKSEQEHADGMAQTSFSESFAEEAERAQSAPLLQHQSFVICTKEQLFAAQQREDAMAHQFDVKLKELGQLQQDQDQLRGLIQTFAEKMNEKRDRELDIWGRIEEVSAKFLHEEFLDTPEPPNSLGPLRRPAPLSVLPPNSVPPPIYPETSGVDDPPVPCASPSRGQPESPSVTRQSSPLASSGFSKSPSATAPSSSSGASGSVPLPAQRQPTRTSPPSPNAVNTAHASTQTSPDRPVPSPVRQEEASEIPTGPIGSRSPAAAGEGMPLSDCDPVVVFRDAAAASSAMQDLNDRPMPSGLLLASLSTACALPDGTVVRVDGLPNGCCNDLADVLQTAGHPPVHIDEPSATLTFASPSHALHAINRLNGAHWATTPGPIWLTPSHASAGPQGASSWTQPCALLMSGVPSDASDRSVLALCTRDGGPPPTVSGRSAPDPDVAVVTFPHGAAALEALRALNGCAFQGQRLAARLTNASGEAYLAHLRAVGAPCRLAVGPLPAGVTPGELRGIFGAFGRVSAVSVAAPNAAAEAMGEVVFASGGDMLRAVDALNGRRPQGHRLLARLADGAAAAGPGARDDGLTVTLRNVPVLLSERGVRGLLALYGPVRGVRGLGCQEQWGLRAVEARFARAADALAAVAALNGTLVPAPGLRVVPEGPGPPPPGAASLLVIGLTSARHVQQLRALLGLYGAVLGLERYDTAQAAGEPSEAVLRVAMRFDPPAREAELVARVQAEGGIVARQRPPGPPSACLRVVVDGAAGVPSAEVVRHLFGGYGELESVSFAARDARDAPGPPDPAPARAVPRPYSAESPEGPVAQGPRLRVGSLPGTLLTAHDAFLQPKAGARGTGPPRPHSSPASRCRRGHNPGPATGPYAARSGGTADGGTTADAGGPAPAAPGPAAQAPPPPPSPGRSPVGLDRSASSSPTGPRQRSASGPAASEAPGPSGGVPDDAEVAELRRRRAALLADVHEHEALLSIRRTELATLLEQHETLRARAQAERRRSQAPDAGVGRPQREASLEAAFLEAARAPLRIDGYTSMEERATQDRPTQCALQADDVAAVRACAEGLLQREGAVRHQLERIHASVAWLIHFNSNLIVDMTCKHCLNLYRDARTLWPCGHSFCRSCLEDMKVDGDCHKCEECTAVTDEGYVTNHIVNALVGRWLFRNAGVADLNRIMEDIMGQLRAMQSSLDRRPSGSHELRTMLLALASMQPSARPASASSTGDSSASSSGD